MKSNIFVTVLMTVLCSACGKKFLEIPPQNAISSSTFYKTEDDFVQAVNGTYAVLRNLYGDAYVMGEMRSDNTHYILKATDRGGQNVEKEQIADFMEDANNRYVANKWTNCYNIIARANIILSQIDGAVFDESKKKNLKGQTLFLRAFAYFELVQYFGDVPLHLTPSTGQSDVALPKSPKTDVYNQIIADTKEAIDLLPGRAAQEKGRATTGSAKTLLGHVYMVMKQYADAETVLKEVTAMGYALLTDYAAVFALENKNSTESVFEIQYMQGTFGLQSNFAYQFIPGLTDTKPLTGLTGNNSSFGGWNTPSDDLIKAYEPGDKRKDASIAVYTSGAGSYPYIKKYLHAHTNFNNTDDNWPVYRYAGVLLLLAEALNERGKTADALTFLNQVRAHPRTGLPASTETNQVALRAIIARERRIELAFENHRWPDLVRTGKAIEVMTAYGAAVKANPALYYYPTGTGPLPQTYSVTESRLLFPIPERETILNPLLK